MPGGPCGRGGQVVNSVLEDGIMTDKAMAPAAHAHGGHSHVHPPKHTQMVLNRLSRAIGHLEGVKKMVGEDRDCSEVLVQLSAARASITSLGKLVLKEHIATCVVDAVEHGDQARIDELNAAIAQFLK